MKTAALADVCDVTMGQAPTGDTYNDSGDGLPLIAGAGDFGETLPAAKKWTTATGVRASKPGDIIVGIRASIGDKVWSDGTYCLGRGVAGLRAKGDLDQQYLWHWVTYAAPTLSAKGRGATFLQVNKRDVTEMEIPVPPIEEQRRIAAVLDAADALRAKRRQALAKLDTLTQSIFLDMFVTGDPDLPTATIESIAAETKGAIRTGPFGSQLLHDEFVDQGVAVLGIDNAVKNRFEWAKPRFVTAEKFAQLTRYQVYPGDVLVTIMGTCGRTAIVPEDIPPAINTKHLCCITLDQEQCLPEFLWACLRFHPSVLRSLGAARGAVMPGLNMGRVKGAEIPLPTIDHQQGFADLKRSAERSSSQLQASQSQLDALFSSLQQRAFRGEL